MSPIRACLTAAIMSVPPTLLFVINSGRFSAYAVLIVSILINWPLIRWLDDRQWYREWKGKNKEIFLSHRLSPDTSRT